MTDSSRQRRDHVTAILNDLIQFTDTAARLVARGKEVYESDEAVRLAAEAILHKIGEAVARLPDDFVTDHAGVAWRSMKATRNIVAHRYEQVDYQIIWNALAHRLPAEADRIRQILAQRAAGPPR
ncbi:MAG TPA: HepT-like ribonuclease domain-containing protein [Mycobacterium sp.]|nr:HepT-like ribonuclease domain-containing protein [Mycobacterium sp.]